MTFTIDVTTVAAPDIVLEAVRQKAACWQESSIPPAVRRLGVLGVKASVEGSQFELAAEDFGRDPPPTVFVLRGKATALATGGTRVQAWPHAPRAGWLTTAIALGLALWLVISGSVVLGTLLILVFCIYGARVSSPSPNDSA